MKLIKNKGKIENANRKCKLCEVEYRGRVNSHFCGECKIILHCSICNSDIEMYSGEHRFYELLRKNTEDKPILEYLTESEELYNCSRSCDRIRRNLNGKSFGKCNICGNEDNLYLGRCSECQRIESINKYCEICEANTPHRGSSCLSCRAREMRKSEYFGSDRHKQVVANNCIKMNEVNIQNNHWQSEQMIQLNKNKVQKMIQYNFENGVYENNGIRKRFCPECNTETNHNGKTCLVCNPDKAGGAQPNFIIKDKVRYYKGIEINEFIRKIKSGELNITGFSGINWRGNRLCYYTEDIITSDKVLTFNNFIELDGTKFYKNIEINELIRQLDAGEIEIPPGFSKRFGEWYYKTENILTGEITKLNGSLFEERNNVLYYYDKSEDTQDYILWESFKSKFSTYNIDFELPEGFKMYTTFRTQESKDWTGAREAFEQSLIEAEIAWFTYIKFDINNKPLVVGKSGSLLVNDSGSDVSFSTDINDGPARRFLKENNLDWCKTQIAICPCKTEQEAFSLESKIMKNYSLFGS